LAFGGLDGLAEAKAGKTAFRRSLSISPFTEHVLRHVHLTDGHRTARTVREVQQLFNHHGATEVYARIATLREVNDGDSRAGFATGLERARLAKSLHRPFNPELGLFARYGDASNYQQPPDFRDYPKIRLPARWTSLTIEQMERAMQHYGELVARQIRGTGVRVNVWDLGNEVEFGVAGVTIRPGSGTYHPPDRVDPAIGTKTLGDLIGMPVDERIAWLRRHLWPYVGRLLAATAKGIRSVHHSAKFSTHISGIFEDNAQVALAFWEEMARVGCEPHQLGTSYYASAGAIGGAGNRLTWLKETSVALRRRFKKRLMIAEGGYPSGILTGGYPYNTPVPGYPQTPAGQQRFWADVIDWGERTGNLAGVRPWAPDFCYSSSGWEPMSFFTPRGHTARAKPVLRVFNA
jgi:hypothetical protein